VVIGEDRFPGWQGRLLFAYWVLKQARPVPRDELAEALWGEAPPATWDKGLTVLATKLRALLTELGSGDAITLTGAFGCYRLDLPEGTWIDVLAAATAAQEAEAALAADDLEQAKTAATRAASLARHPFLPGEEGSWVEERRRQLADIRSRALACLADASLRSRNASAAATWAEEAIALEPFREAGYRRLMEAHAAAGNRAEALRVYERCRRILAEELGAYPSPETESIYRELLAASPPDARATAEAARVAVSESKPEQEASAAILLRRVRGRDILIAIGAAVLAVAAIAVAFIQFTGGGSQTAGSVAANSLAAVDPETNRLVAAVPVGSGPSTVAAGDGAVWVVNKNDQTVSRIDVGTGTVRQTVKVGGGPSAVAVGAGAVWVANGLDGTVSRIDPKTNEVVQTITVGNTPSAIAYGEGAVWVTNADDGTLSKLDPASGDVVQTLPVDAPARGIAVGAGVVWLTDPVGNALVRLDARTTTVTRVNVGSGPTAVAFGGGAVWVANNLDGTVSRINADSGVLTNTVQVGVAPNGIAVTPDAVWVTDEAAGSLVRVDPGSRKPTARRRLGGRAQGLALADGSLWVALQAGAAAHRGGTLRLLIPPGEVDSIDLPARTRLSPGSCRASRATALSASSASVAPRATRSCPTSRRHCRSRPTVVARTRSGSARGCASRPGDLSRPPTCATRSSGCSGPVQRGRTFTRASWAAGRAGSGRSAASSHAASSPTTRAGRSRSTCARPTPSSSTSLRCRLLSSSPPALPLMGSAPSRQPPRTELSATSRSG
jgi:YVTN family beta-propeller protein